MKNPLPHNTDTACPCCSGNAYANCCEPIIAGNKPAPTAEALMRSRYTAYSQANVDYIELSMRGIAAKNFNKDSAKVWASNCMWLSLEVVDTKQGTVNDNVGWVEFIAQFRGPTGKEETLHERSKFRKYHGDWYYIDGNTPAHAEK